MRKVTRLPPRKKSNPEYVPEFKPNARPEFPPTDTSRFDPQSVYAWQAGALCLHTQDSRLTDFERAMVMEIGNRLFGGRVTVN